MGISSDPSQVSTVAFNLSSRWDPGRAATNLTMLEYLVAGVLPPRTLGCDDPMG